MPPDGQGGALLPNKTWTGMIGQLVDGKIEIGLEKTHFWKLALGEFTYGELAFGELAFVELAFVELTFGELAFGELTYENLLLKSW
jgi:hypothetical protein